MKNQANFLFEASTLKRLQRTGWQILGENRESIAEHSYMVSIISYVIGRENNANIEKVLLMALFHDFTETRIGDIYKLADFYVKGDVLKAAKHAYEGLPYGQELVKITGEYEDKNSLEAKIVHDADTLALCVELKQLMEKGNTNAKEWFDANLDALVLEKSKSLGRELAKTNSQTWWKKERNQLHKLIKK